MGLIKFLFDRTGAKSRNRRSETPYQSPEPIGPQCRNPNCVTVKEPVSTRRRFELVSDDQANSLILACLYCDHRFKVAFAGNAETKRYYAFDRSLAAAFAAWLTDGKLALFDSIKEAEDTLKRHTDEQLLQGEVNWPRLA